MFARRPDADRVISGLWIGAAPTVRQAHRLADRGISAVVDLRAEAEPLEWPRSILVERIPMIDHGAPELEALSSAAERVAQLMRDGQEVLIHCRAGLERSATLACAVLMRQGWSLRDAYRRVGEARRGAAPTEGQLAALRRLEAALAAGSETR